MADWLHNVAGAIDLSAIQGPIGTIAGRVESVAEGLQQGITTITVDVQSVFTTVQSVIDTLDPAQLQAEVQAAVQRFRDEIIARVSALVGPARAAVLQAVTAIDQAVGAFDPGNVIAAISAAINALAGVLGDGPIGQAMSAVHDGLEAVAKQLTALSFTPTADSVVSVIDSLRSTLEAIDPALLPSPAADALKSAASVLPGDLEPITDPIIDSFGEIVDSGPTPVLEQVRDAPAQLLEAVRSFDPESLVGDQLTGPFNSVLRSMEQFRPSDLLKPVGKELDAFKQQLRKAASPGRAAQALQAPFDALKQTLANFDPNALVQPLQGALATVRDGLLKVVPVDETFAIIDEGLAAVQRVLDTMDAVVRVLRRVHEAANSLVGVRGQLDAWVNNVLARVEWHYGHVEPGAVAGQPAHRAGWHARVGDRSAFRRGHGHGACCARQRERHDPSRVADPGASCHPAARAAGAAGLGAEDRTAGGAGSLRSTAARVRFAMAAAGRAAPGTRRG